jgi:hypothetical protein
VREVDYTSSPLRSSRRSFVNMSPQSDAAKRFMRSYDKFTIALCTTAAVAYGAARYYDLPEAPDDFDLKTWFLGGYDVPKVDEPAKKGKA